MESHYDTIIVIPCYNEGKKIDVAAYSKFISDNDQLLLCFVNDGSKDNTHEVLQGIKDKYPKKVEIISYVDNGGKAHAVWKGMNECLEKFSFKYIAYLDADLAVSLDECKEMSAYIEEEIVFCFGSRIAKIGSEIDRKHSRFLIGRFIATLISNILSLKVYDTQCGCKVFTKEVAEDIFKDPFISKWLFDVEIFFRIIAIYGREKCLKVMLEIPLKRWTEMGDSKVKNSYFFKLFFDLLAIRKAYRNVGGS